MTISNDLYEFSCDYLNYTSLTETYYETTYKAGLQTVRLECSNGALAVTQCNYTETDTCRSILNLACIEPSVTYCNRNRSSIGANCCCACQPFCHCCHSDNDVSSRTRKPKYPKIRPPPYVTFLPSCITKRIICRTMVNPNALEALHIVLTATYTTYFTVNKYSKSYYEYG